jgi:hypothetical protein
MSAPESEYSPTAIPGGAGISAVRVEADSAQRLWRFDPDGTNGEVLLPEPAPVGYHAWAGPRALALFVLGEPPTLQLVDLDAGTTQVVAEGIGRSLQPIPGSSDISFTRMNADGSSTIMRLRVDSRQTEPLVDAIDGGEFHAWAPNGRLLMGSGSKLFAWRPESTGGWREIADLAPQRVRITRVAVSPDGSHIALVVEPGEVDLP